MEIPYVTSVKKKCSVEINIWPTQMTRTCNSNYKIYMNQ